MRPPVETEYLSGGKTELFGQQEHRSSDAADDCLYQDGAQKLAVQESALFASEQDISAGLCGIAELCGVAAGDEPFRAQGDCYGVACANLSCLRFF